MSHQAAVPVKIASYFDCGQHPEYLDHPVVGQVFTPGKGWKTVGGRQRVSHNKMRKLRAEGATAVAVRYQGRLADFTLAEALYVDRRPFLGGRLL